MENEKLKDIYNRLCDLLKENPNSIPQTSSGGLHFPRFVYEKLLDWLCFFDKAISPVIDEFIKYKSIDIKIESFRRNLSELVEGLFETLTCYYEGKVRNAISKFEKTMNACFIAYSGHIGKIERGTTFYRARKGQAVFFKRSDLFHLPFELRYKVSTQRYSIPGFPALYLGDSAYVCWEELERPDIKELNFSRFCLKNDDLKIIEILRPEDFLSNIKEISMADGIHHILQYLAIFPITMVCSIRVEYNDAPFKPEYIIPQLLMQFVTDGNKFDGIKYPSTRINYALIEKVPAYNYVFPVREINEKGYCERLIRNFSLTEPTSIEFESMLFKTDLAFSTSFESDWPRADKKIKLTADGYVLYDTTSFGFIEKKLSYSYKQLKTLTE